MSKYINDGIEVYSDDSGKEDSDKNKLWRRKFWIRTLNKIFFL